MFFKNWYYNYLHITCSWLFKYNDSFKQFSLRYFYSHDIFHCFGLNKNGDWVQLGNLQPFDRITRNVKNTMFTLKSKKEKGKWK